MKKIFILFLIVCCSSIFANTLEFTGRYSENLSNPFKKLLIKSKDSLHVFSKEKNIILPVVSNFKNLKNDENSYPNNYTLKNKTIENIVKHSFSDYFDVKINKADKFTEINIISGKVNLMYSNPDNEKVNYLNKLFKIGVELSVEIVEHINDKSIIKLKKISLNQNIDQISEKYKLDIDYNDNLNKVILNNTVSKIIEMELFYLARGGQFE